MRLVFYSDHFGRKVKDGFKYKKKNGEGERLMRERDMKWAKSRTIVVGIKRKDPEI